MDVLDLISTDNFILYNKSFAKKHGAENAILFGAMCGYQRGFGQEEFFREQEKIMEDTGLSEYSVRKYIKELIEMGYISVIKKGMPARFFYKVNRQKILDLYFNSGAENATTSGAVFDTTSGAVFDTSSGVEIAGDYKNNYDKNKYKNNYNNNISGEFVAPSFEDVALYARTKKRMDACEPFFNYYTKTDWCYKSGEKMTSWKDSFDKWIARSAKKDDSEKTQTTSGYGARKVNGVWKR